MTALDKAITIEDLRGLALARLPRFFGEYIERGAGDGGTARRNIEAFQHFRLVPRALVDVTPIDTGVALFGRTYGSCFGISAVGSAGAYRPHADEMLARAAADANLPFILSSAATSPVETICRIAKGNTWYQIYASRFPEVTERMIGRVRDAGVEVLVLTVDFATRPRSEVSARTGVSLAAGPSLRNFPAIFLDAMTHPGWTARFLAHGLPKLDAWAPFAPPGSSARQVVRFFAESTDHNTLWRDVDRIRSQWRGRLVVKGLVHPDDILQAVAAGADAVTISNHGGNKLDCMPAALESLVAVRRKVGPGIPLFLDGGIRRGSDIIIARALGADHCFVGRPTLYGVTAAGYAGARRALGILQSELVHTMAMIGCKRVAGITRDNLADDAGPHALPPSAPATPLAH